MDQLLEDLDSMRQTLTMEIDEAVNATHEHRIHWETLEAGAVDGQADDVAEEIAAARRSEAKYLARAEALTLALVRLEAVLSRYRDDATPQEPTAEVNQA